MSGLGKRRESVDRRTIDTFPFDEKSRQKGGRILVILLVACHQAGKSDCNLLSLGEKSAESLSPVGPFSPRRNSRPKRGRGGTRRDVAAVAKASHIKGGGRLQITTRPRSRATARDRKNKHPAPHEENGLVSVEFLQQFITITVSEKN